MNSSPKNEYSVGTYPHVVLNFLLLNTVGEVLKNVHAVLFHTIEVNVDQSCQAPKRTQMTQALHFQIF